MKIPSLLYCYLLIFLTPVWAAAVQIEQKNVNSNCNVAVGENWGTISLICGNDTKSLVQALIETDEGLLRLFSDAKPPLTSVTEALKAKVPGSGVSVAQRYFENTRSSTESSGLEWFKKELLRGLDPNLIVYQIDLGEEAIINAAE
jgi:hypothetical protein